MRQLMLLLGAFAAASAAGADAVFGQVPRGEYIDTEASTNVPFAFARSGVRDFRFELTFAATPSNNVQLAFGRDADGDGLLAADEADMTFAWDCGEWRVENVVGRECIAASAATTNAAKHVEWDLGMRRMRPRRLVVKENGVAIFTELPDSPEQWLYSPDWDLVRLTVRGVDAADEGARVGLNISGYAIRLR